MLLSFNSIPFFMRGDFGKSKKAGIVLKITFDAAISFAKLQVFEQATLKVFALSDVKYPVTNQETVEAGSSRNKSSDVRWRIRITG